MRVMDHVKVGILAVAVAGLLAAPAARADITASNITTPTDPSFFIDDHDAAAAQEFTVSGTTTGGNTASDTVDIRCYYGTTSRPIVGGVPLNADGSFSSAHANFDHLPDQVCRLRAIPHNMSPADVSPFAGPRIGKGERSSSPLGSGMNAGLVYDYFIYGQGLTAAFDYDSLGGCGIDDGYLFDATFAQTTRTFYCNAYLKNGDTPTGATRSELQIDGVDAYTPFGAEQINADATGFPAVSYSYSLDPHTGDLLIHETDPLVKCGTTTYPPDATKCATFDSTGVTDTRTIAQSHDGHLADITDVFSSTDGASHPIDLLWENHDRFHGSAGDANDITYQFPGESSFSKHAVGDDVTLPATGGTILLKVDGASDGDTNTGQGAIVYDRPATDAKFTAAFTSDVDFHLHQAGTVPAGGSTTFRFAYAQAFTSADVAALAQFATDQFGAPTVHISSPANGAVLHTPSVAVSGTAADNVGVTALSVGGHAVAVGPGGAWTTTVALHAGANTIAAVAADGAGNTAQDQVAVTYQPTSAPPPVRCKVPRLKGKKLAAAKRALKKAHCRAGKVFEKKSRKIRKGRVISSSPAAHKVRKAGTKVKLTVSRGRH